MADRAFRCRVVTPAESLLDEQTVYASIPAFDGLMGVLPGRAPLVTRLGVGELTIRTATEGSDRSTGGERSFFVDSGFIKMAEGDLIILAERAIPAERLSEQDAQAELAEAEARVADPDAPDPAAEADRLRLDKERARVKLRMAKQVSKAGI